jgi:hypothetical protein
MLFDKFVEKIKTHLAVYEIMFTIIVERAGHRDGNVAHRIACWIPKATNTHS